MIGTRAREQRRVAKGALSMALAISILVAIADPAEAVKIYPSPPPGCDGPNVIHGDDGNNTISGTPGNDIICGHGGSDTIFGQGGSDIIYAGSGNDYVYGGSGRDWIAGEGGSDHLYGEQGEDEIYGGNQRDWIYGGANADHIAGQGGDDYIKGGRGNDQIWGGTGVDRIWGDQNSDTLRGGAQDDLIWGGPGDDRLLGEAGTDKLRGEGGTDTCIGGSGFSDWVSDSDCEARKTVERLLPPYPALGSCDVGESACNSFLAFSGWNHRGILNSSGELVYPVSRRQNCTAYVAFRLRGRGLTHVSDPGPSYPQGNAYQWNDPWHRQDLSIKSSPRPGDVAQWEALGSLASNNCDGVNCGHVAYVERVFYRDGEISAIVVSESSWDSGAAIRKINVGSGSWPSRFLRYDP